MIDPKSQSNLKSMLFVWSCLCLIFLMFGYPIYTRIVPKHDAISPIDGIASQISIGWVSYGGGRYGGPHAGPHPDTLKVGGQPLCIQKLVFSNLVSPDTLEKLAGSHVHAETSIHDNCRYIYALEANGLPIFTYEKAYDAITLNNHLAGGSIITLGIFCLMQFFRVATTLLGQAKRS